MYTNLSTFVRLLLCSILVSGGNAAWAYRDDDHLLAFQQNLPFNEIQNPLNLPQLNFRAPDLPSFRGLQTPLAPSLNINAFSMRLPEIQVPDLGDSVWSYERVSSNFNTDTKLF